MMKYFPIFLDLADKRVLMAGGGERALQKLRLLLKTSAEIKLVAPSFADEILSLAENGNVRLVSRELQESDFAGVSLFYAASESDEDNERYAAIARQQGVLVNAVDAPKTCDFITPALVERTPITVAIGTEGYAPILAREIKALLDRILPANLGSLAKTGLDVRAKLEKRITDGRLRLRIFERLMRGRYRDATLRGDHKKASQILSEEITAAEVQDIAKLGSVALVGAGPGNPDLLTLRAQQKLQDADVLIIDRLVEPRILDYARRDAKRIYVGKKAGGPSTSQDQINQIIVREALEGSRVVRVKGGDPNLFGRAQEELAACQLFGIDVEVVPGISAAQAASASLKLPLTARGSYRSITFLTAATKDKIIADDVIHFMKAKRPFAVYMGVKLAGEIVEGMQCAGADLSAQVIVVENASLEQERAFAMRLGDLDSVIKSRGITGPAILFFGLSFEEMGLMVDQRVEVVEPSNVVPLARRVS